MTCTCCSGELDSRDFDVRDVCDRCLGYLLAGVKHTHEPPRRTLLAVCDPEHREDVE